MNKFKTYELAVEFYQRCEAYRISSHHLKDQLHRASSSIALNPAEGAAKPTNADRLKFYYQALGSVRECHAVLQLTKLAHDSSLLLLSDKLTAHIYKLIKAYETGSSPNRVTPISSLRSNSLHTPDSGPGDGQGTGR